MPILHCVFRSYMCWMLPHPQYWNRGAIIGCICKRAYILKVTLSINLYFVVLFSIPVFTFMLSYVFISSALLYEVVIICS